MLLSSISSLHQPLHRRPRVRHLFELSLRTLEVREKFLIFVDSLIALASTLVELAQVVVGEDSKYRKPPCQSRVVLQVAYVPLMRDGLADPMTRLTVDAIIVGGKLPQVNALRQVNWAMQGPDLKPVLGSQFPVFRLGRVEEVISSFPC
ncbi:hypothetical protein SBA7_1080002 [Candidatus Sulfotelmatobacter sp. SbA7]|jgi:hypothetical protein|nr:hypothetical protein SBA7_1080002 [Candidatus Sulfotelmatobacter sp. SbA7]